MLREEIRERVFDIGLNVLNQENKQISESELLSSILNESRKAITFVSLIEDEFEIEFEDDEIDSDFFYSIDNILNCIENHYR